MRVRCIAPYTAIFGLIQQLSIQRNIQQTIQQTIQQVCPSERFAPVGRPIGSNYLAKASVVARAIALYRAHSPIKELGRARSTRCADLMEGSQGRRLASVCTQLEEDAGRNGRERRVENATHLLEAWDCIWSHGALAQARAIQVAASSLWAARERRLLPGGGHGTMLRHDGAAQREEGPTVERQLARPTAV